MILLRNGTIIDGTGTGAFAGDLLIDGDRIAEVGDFEALTVSETVDCSGFTIAPGFIDAHSHSDLQVLEGRREKLIQGVTTEVVGNCGFSTYPAPEDPAPLYEFANGLFCGDDSWGWKNAKEYLSATAAGPNASVVSLVGHGSLRIAVAGNRQGRLSESRLDTMEGMLEEAFDQGAAGFSTGLMYAPGSSAPFEELVRLCRVVTRHDKIYTTHIRSYISGVIDAVEEQLELARRSGCRLQISHLQVVGASNWDKQARVLDQIEQARADGIDVAFDCYPYVAGSTVMTQLLPQSALDGGLEALMARLEDPDERKRIAAATDEVLEWRWNDIYISAVHSDWNRQAVGCNLAELAEEWGRPPVDVMIDLLIQERGQVNILSFNQSEENLRETLSHPLSIIISDGFYVRGRPHPRLHGTFPLLLGTIVRQRNWMSIEEAVHKIADLPARRFQIKDRGRLASGYFADVTVFDANSVDSPATYDDPEQKPVGIKYVFRNGALLEGPVCSG
jgi:dihydroorotase/N-acyl-D-amino-acid deacylase